MKHILKFIMTAIAVMMVVWMPGCTTEKAEAPEVTLKVVPEMPASTRPADNPDGPVTLVLYKFGTRETMNSPATLDGLSLTIGDKSILAKVNKDMEHWAYSGLGIVRGDQFWFAEVSVWRMGDPTWNLCSWPEKVKVGLTETYPEAIERAFLASVAESNLESKLATHDRQALIADKSLSQGGFSFVDGKTLSTRFADWVSQDPQLAGFGDAVRDLKAYWGVKAVYAKITWSNLDTKGNKLATEHAEVQFAAQPPSTPRYDPKGQPD
ncbi:MAG: hypothetical protein WC080_03560 [Patescibacteria group bacterium]